MPCPRTEYIRFDWLNKPFWTSMIGLSLANHGCSSAHHFIVHCRLGITTHMTQNFDQRWPVAAANCTIGFYHMPVSKSHWTMQIWKHWFRDTYSFSSPRKQWNILNQEGCGAHWNGQFRRRLSDDTSNIRKELEAFDILELPWFTEVLEGAQWIARSFLAAPKELTILWRFQWSTVIDIRLSSTFLHAGVLP